MTGQKKGEREPEETEEELETEEDDDTLSVRRAADDDDDDDSVDSSIEINIEELVSKLDSIDGDDVARRRAIKRRIEELRELREAERDLDSTYNFNLDDDD